MQQLGMYVILCNYFTGTKERTEKVPLSSIKNVVSEPIDGHDDYHILALQLGPTEASRYYVSNLFSFA